MSNDLTVYQAVHKKDDGKLTIEMVILLLFVILYILIYQLVRMILTPIGILTIVIFTLLWKYVL
jgi:hypothetical protein